MTYLNRYGLDQQGYGDLDDGTLEEVNRWLSLAPAVCSGVGLAATLAASGSTLLLLAPVGVIAAATGRHPAEWLADRTVRRRLRPLPLARAPRRFAYAFASAWLVAAGAAFLAGMTLLGAVLGLAFSVATGMAAATDFCLACAIWHGLRRPLAPGVGRRAPVWPSVRLEEGDV